MLKTAFVTFIVICIAVLGGGASVWYALQAKESLGAVTIGEWTAFPDIGTPDADPYSKARVAREGSLSLGRAEGLSFVAQQDSGGQTLRRECEYKLEGPVPSARFWTLYAADTADALIGSGKRRAAAFHSYELLRRGRQFGFRLHRRAPQSRKLACAVGDRQDDAQPHLLRHADCQQHRSGRHKTA